MNGETVTCTRVGERLPEVVDRVNEFLVVVCNSASSPLQHEVCYGALDSFEMETARSCAMHRLAAVAEDHCKHYEAQPYSLARIKTVEQLGQQHACWQALPEPKRHRVATYLFSGNLYVNWDYCRDLSGNGSKASEASLPGDRSEPP